MADPIWLKRQTFLPVLSAAKHGPGRVRQIATVHRTGSTRCFALAAALTYRRPLRGARLLLRAVP